MKGKFKLKIYPDNYVKCSWCETAYVTMLKIDTKYLGEKYCDGQGTIYLCKECFCDIEIKIKELTSLFETWE